MSDDMIDMVLEDAGDKMDKVVAHTRQDFAGVRTGRASSSFVEKLVVNVYGVEMKMQELATFSIPESRQLLITPHDAQNVGPIEKSIRNADLGLSPSNDGRSIRLNFPPLTEQRRKEFVKMVKGMAEDGRVKVRVARRAARKDLDDLEKDGEVSSDDLQRAEKRLDGMTHGYEAKIDEALHVKEQELLEV